MEPTLRWPSYQTGPHDSIFALGVVSANYANFERAVTWMLAAIMWVPEELARIVQAQNGSATTFTLMDRMLVKRNWSREATELIHYFLAASRILTENRNRLMHSMVLDGAGDTTSLYSVSRKGEFQTIEVSAAEIRQVADDLVTYFNFALNLANWIAVEIHKADRHAGTIVVHTLPLMPPMPKSLSTGRSSAA